MSDLIEREDAIDELMHIIPYKRYHNGEYVFLLNKRECLKAIKAIPSADRLQEWIPCSERLPSEKDYIGDVVIWCTDKSIVGVGWYYESTKSWATIDDTFPPILGEVIAWMPLPSAYQGE